MFGGSDIDDNDRTLIDHILQGGGCECILYGDGLGAVTMKLLIAISMPKSNIAFPTSRPIEIATVMVMVMVVVEWFVMRVRVPCAVPT